MGCNSSTNNNQLSGDSVVRSASILRRNEVIMGSFSMLQVRSQSVIVMDTILREPIICKLFDQQLRKKFKEHYLHLWLSISEFQDVPCITVREFNERAKKIYNKFLKKGSAFYCSIIDANLISRILIILEDEDPDQGIFDDIQEVVFTLLKQEHMNNFLVSAAYLNMEEVAINNMPLLKITWGEPSPSNNGSKRRSSSRRRVDKALERALKDDIVSPSAYPIMLTKETGRKVLSQYLVTYADNAEDLLDFWIDVNDCNENQKQYKYSENRGKIICKRYLNDDAACLLTMVPQDIRHATIRNVDKFLAKVDDDSLVNKRKMNKYGHSYKSFRSLNSTGGERASNALDCSESTLESEPTVLDEEEIIISFEMAPETEMKNDDDVSAIPDSSKSLSQPSVQNNTTHGIVTEHDNIVASPSFSPRGPPRGSRRSSTGEIDMAIPLEGEKASPDNSVITRSALHLVFNEIVQLVEKQLYEVHMPELFNSPTFMFESFKESILMEEDIGVSIDFLRQYKIENKLTANSAKMDYVLDILESLDRILTKKDALRFFKKYLMEQKIDNYLNFYLATLEFEGGTYEQSKYGEHILKKKGQTERDVLGVRAKMMYDTFIREHANECVPLPNELRDSIRQSLSHPSRTMFHEASKEIYAIMEEGPFISFRDHDEYSKCKGHLLRKALRDSLI